jgi:hypothetical protein
MKWLVSILVIANISLFLWFTRQNADTSVDGVFLRPDVNPKSMQLLKEAVGEDVLAEYERNAQIEQNREADKANALTTEENRSQTTPPSNESATTNNSETTQAKPLANICVRIGPFESSSIWKRSRAWVQKTAITVKSLRGEGRQFKATRIYLGPYTNVAEAEPTIKRLKKLKLDHFKYRDRSEQTRISMGYFTQETLAIKYVAYLKTLDLTTQTESDYRDLASQDWIEAIIADNHQASYLARKWGEKNSKAAVIPCSTLN